MSEFFYPDFGNYYGYYNAGVNVASAIGPILIVSFILALCVAMFFLPQRNRGRFSPMLEKLYNFLNFNVFWVSWIIKVMFAAMAIFLLIMGIYVMFALSFWAGLALIISILLVRVVYESIYAILSIRDNVDQINRRLSGKPVDPEEPARQFAPRNGGFSFRDFAQRGPRRPEAGAESAPADEPLPEDQIKTADADAKFCVNCGAELRPGAMFCANCGSKVQ